MKYSPATSYAQAAVNLGFTRTRGLSNLKDDGTLVAVGQGLFEYFGTITPENQLVGSFVTQEVNAVAAKAYADSCNARWGRGFATPWQPDPNAPAPAPGTPRQRLITLDARGWGNLDELAPAFQSGDVLKAGAWGGILQSGGLPTGYVFTATDRADALLLKDLADAMGKSSTGGVAAADKASAETVVAWEQAGGITTGYTSASAWVAAGSPKAPPASQVATLVGNRFVVTVPSYSAPDGRHGFGTPIPLNDGSCLFWFFSETNAEIFFSLIDAGAGAFWTKVGGATNLAFTLKCEDTQTGHIWTYVNPMGKMLGVIDTSAFAK